MQHHRIEVKHLPIKARRLSEKLARESKVVWRSWFKSIVISLNKLICSISRCLHVILVNISDKVGCQCYFRFCVDNKWPNASSVYIYIYIYTNTKNNLILTLKHWKTNWKIFTLQTRLSSRLIEYPINKALCHICSLMKATSWKHTRM